jgi:ankyrin repeat protein
MTDIDELDRDGRSALHMAAHANDAEKVAELIAAGANLGLQDRIGYTPLHMAAQQYSVEAARLLLDAGAAVDPVDAHGNTPLFRATFDSRGRGEMIKLLRKHGADADLVNKHDQTPRGLAHLIGNYDVKQFYED